MSKTDTMTNQWTRFQNRLYARLSQRQKAVSGFVGEPEPRTVGSFARGRQLVAGNLLFAGYLVEAQETELWDVAAPSTGFDNERHGFAWLDDLAAVGDMRAREKAQRWVWGWINAHGRGQGPGWAPDLTGRRVIRWINHAIFLLREYFRSIPEDLISAARLDGAGTLRILWSIVVPLSRPILTTLTIITVVTHWNNFLWPLIITSGRTWQTVTVATAGLQSQYNGNWTLVMAATTVAIAPLLLLFAVFQKNIVSSIAITGFK